MWVRLYSTLLYVYLNTRIVSWRYLPPCCVYRWQNPKTSYNVGIDEMRKVTENVFARMRQVCVCFEVFDLFVVCCVDKQPTFAIKPR